MVKCKDPYIISIVAYVDYGNDMTLDFCIWIYWLSESLFDISSHKQTPHHYRPRRSCSRVRVLVDAPRVRVLVVTTVGLSTDADFEDRALAEILIEDSADFIFGTTPRDWQSKMRDTCYVKGILYPIGDTSHRDIYIFDRVPHAGTVLMTKLTCDCWGEAPWLLTCGSTHLVMPWLCMGVPSLLIGAQGPSTYRD